MTTKTNKKPAVKINSGNLDLNAVYTATGKVARATHNADRHVTLNGKTVREALQSRRFERMT